MTQEQRVADNTQLSKENELHDVRDESLQLQREMNLALQQLRDDEGKLHEMEKEMKALQTQNVELSRSHQEMRFQLSEREDTCIMLQARLNETSLQHDRADDEAQRLYPLTAQPLLSHFSLTSLNIVQSITALNTPSSTSSNNEFSNITPLNTPSIHKPSNTPTKCPNQYIVCIPPLK